MRPAIALAVIAAALPAVVLTAPASAGRHGGSCPAYSSESYLHSSDDTRAQKILLNAEFVYEVADRIDQTQPVKGLAAAAVAAAAAAHLDVSGRNRIADACYEPRHMVLQDDLMKMTLQAQLASTATPDVQFVTREQRPDGHIPPTSDVFPGYIDRERPEAQNDVEGWGVLGVRTNVRGVIDAMKSTEQCTCSAAESSYTQAVSALGNGQLKTAYKLFRQAYAYAFSN